MEGRPRSCRRAVAPDENLGAARVDGGVAPHQFGRQLPQRLGRVRANQLAQSLSGYIELLGRRPIDTINVITTFGVDGLTQRGTRCRRQQLRLTQHGSIQAHRLRRELQLGEQRFRGHVLLRSLEEQPPRDVGHAVRLP